MCVSGWQVCRDVCARMFVCISCEELCDMYVVMVMHVWVQHGVCVFKNDVCMDYYLPLGPYLAGLKRKYQTQSASSFVGGPWALLLLCRRDK